MRIICIPVKSLGRSKTRLSSVLGPLERGVLTLAMLEDLLDVTAAVPGWETWVVSADDVVLEIAARRGARPVSEAKPPLSSAVRQIEREAIGNGAEALTILLGDVALATTEALSAALRTLGPVVVAPAKGGGGTNLLLRRPPRTIQARFGRDSLSKHMDAAAAKGLPVAVVSRAELAFDLDGPQDIAVLLESGKQGRTRQALLEMGVLSRIPARA